MLVSVVATHTIVYVTIVCNEWPHRALHDTVPLMPPPGGPCSAKIGVFMGVLLLVVAVVQGIIHFLAWATLILGALSFVFASRQRGIELLLGGLSLLVLKYLIGFVFVMATAWKDSRSPKARDHSDVPEPERREFLKEEEEEEDDDYEAEEDEEADESLFEEIVGLREGVASGSRSQPDAEARRPSRSMKTEALKRHDQLHDWKRFEFYQTRAQWFLFGFAAGSTLFLLMALRGCIPAP